MPKPNAPVRPAHRTQAERTEATMERLMMAARELFAEKGYVATSTEDVIAAAGVTRGALYHHFDGKAALFKAVFEREEEALAARVMKVAQAEKRGMPSLRAGARAFLEACLDPTVRRIVLSDARSVLPLEELREIESRYTLRLLQSGIADAMSAGAVVDRPVDMLARMMLGALSEAATAIALSTTPKKTLREAQRELDTLLEAIAGAGAR
jgi:AcrR family transcriptional regulator